METTIQRAEQQVHSDHYTGIVVIHGIGNEQRNKTLEDAVNYLTYWFNHHAGLALSPEGSGRVWVTANLTESDDPDAPASRATITLASPGPFHESEPEPEELRLEFSEVWWTQPFTLRSIPLAIKWAWVQYREVTRNLLLPPRVRLGRSRSASRSPTRPIPQTLTDQSAPTSVDMALSFDEAPSPVLVVGVRRVVLQTALRVYGGLQYL